MQIRFRAILIGALVTLPLAANAQTFPGADWQRKTPAEAGINPQLLKDAIDFSIANEIKNPRDLKLNHYRSFGREPIGDAIAPIKLYNPLPMGNRAERMSAPDLIDLFATPHNRSSTWNHLLRQTSDWE